MGAEGDKKTTQTYFGLVPPVGAGCFLDFRPPGWTDRVLLASGRGSNSAVMLGVVGTNLINRGGPKRSAEHAGPQHLSGKQ